MSNESQFRIRIICKCKIKSIKICLIFNTVNLYRYMHVCLCFDDLQRTKVSCIRQFVRRTHPL